MTFAAPQPRAARARRQATGAWLGAALALGAVAEPPERPEPPEKTAQQWLQAMDAAFRELDYDGVFSYYTATRSQPFAFAHGSREVDRAPAPNGQGTLLRRERRAMGFGFGQRGAARLATFRVVHKVIDGVEHERVVQFNGPRREILRVGDQVSYVVQPNDALLRLNGAAPPAPLARVFGRRFETMGDVYDVRVAGRGRVVERAAVHLRVAPRHQDRFGYWLWLDEETGLLLASESKDAAGVNLEIFQFTALRLGDRVAEADLRPAQDGAVVRRLPPPVAQRAEAAPTWQARWVPPGFELTVAAVRRPPDQPRGVSTLVFSDGLAAFSVFVEAMPESGAGTLVSRNGATVVVTHSAVGDDGDHLVTVVGEVPIATARRIAAGVAQRGR